MADRVDEKTRKVLRELVDGLTKERDQLLEEKERLQNQVTESAQIITALRAKCEALNCGVESALEERDEARAEAVGLRERLKTYTAQLNRISGEREHEYDLAEKCILALIMDASYAHGPVELRLGELDEFEDSCKKIVLTSAPDGVIRELMESDLVSHVELNYGGMEIHPIPRGLYGIHGV